MPRIPDEASLNSNYTAIPKDITYADDPHVDADLEATPFDYGEMNEDDARESGYISAPPQIRMNVMDRITYRRALIGAAVAAAGVVAWRAYRRLRSSGTP